MRINNLYENIIEQKQSVKTVEELQKTLNKLNKILESSLDVFCTIDIDGKFTTVNETCKQIWGYESTELIGVNYRELVHEEDLELTINVNEDIREIYSHKLFENRFIHKDGTTVFMLWSVKWEEEENIFYCTAKDISKQKKIERAYLIERQRLQDIYNHIPSGMGIVKGSEYTFELANSLYLKLINKKNIVGKTVKEVMPELKSQGIIEILDSVYTTGEPFVATEKLFQFDINGDKKLVDKYLNLLFQANRDNQGSIDGVVFFVIDVTEQVLSRIKIEESKKQYQELIRELPIATFSCDADGKIKIYNKAAVDLWGGEPDIEKDLRQGSWKVFDSEGNPIVPNLCPIAIALREGKIISDMEIIIESKNGERRHVNSHAVPFIDLTGKITGAVNMLTDITESKERQKALELQNKELANYKYALDESSIVGITDQNGRILYANKNFFKISKYSIEEVIGQDHKMFSSGYHSKEYISNLWKTILKGKTWKGELKNKAKDGTTFWVDATITPFLDENGKPYQFVATRFDITERKNAELNLERQNIELLKTNKELDRFVYSVSHDLRSPLTSIQGLVSIIEEETQEPETLEHVRMIKTSINRLDEFIRKILTYSQNNRTDLELKTIPLKKSFDSIINSLQNMEQAKGIHFEIEIQEKFAFYTDKLRFNTIMENLISNAIKYHKFVDSVRFIKVNGVVDQEKLELTITDNGIGIPSEFQDKIFDMFFRISNNIEGSGIGLYIVKETVEKLEGSIQVRSKINSGTSFHIVLKNFMS